MKTDKSIFLKTQLAIMFSLFIGPKDCFLITQNTINLKQKLTIISRNSSIQQHNTTLICNIIEKLVTSVGFRSWTWPVHIFKTFLIKFLQSFTLIWRQDVLGNNQPWSIPTLHFKANKQIKNKLAFRLIASWGIQQDRCSYSLASSHPQRRFSSVQDSSIWFLTLH